MNGDILDKMVKMSPKGQLVVPQSIRESLGYKPGDRFMPIEQENGIFFKKLPKNKLVQEFEELTAQIRSQLDGSVTEETIEEAIRWARKQK